MSARWFEGLGDTLRVLADALGGAPPEALVRLRADLETAFDARASTVAEAQTWLVRIAASAEQVAAQVADGRPAAQGSEASTGAEATFWAEALVRQAQGLRDELHTLAPWSLMPPVPEGLGDLPALRGVPTLREVAALEAELLPAIDRMRIQASPDHGPWLEDLRRIVSEASDRATERMAEIDRLALLCDDLARMDYGFLYDRGRHLLAIGYNVAERRRDAGYYDLLASEARFGKLRRHRAGTAAAGELVRARAPADHGAAAGRCCCPGAARCSST